MTQWKADALTHALEESPREACGLVVVVKGRERYWRCQNLSDDGDFFVLSPDDYADAEEAGEVTAVFHSHPKSLAIASDADRMGCEKSGLRWYICNPGSGTWCSIDPNGYKAPLIGRQWVWGVSDCWTLVRDWYQEELGIELRDWDRPRDNMAFDADPMFERCFEETGFVDAETNQPQKGDLVFMRLGDSTGLNHVGVYVGEQRLLHHVKGRLSSRDIWGGYYQKNTGRIVRYRGGQ